MYGLYSVSQFAVKASLPTRFGVIFPGVITRELVVVVRSKQVYPRFELQEAACSLKYLGVQHYVILVAFPIVGQYAGADGVSGHPILGRVDGDR